MKKIISAFLILQLVFVLFTFSGCHKNSTLNDSRCLKYYTYCEDSICDLINKYNKYCTVNYNDTYKIEIIKFDSEEEMKLKMSTEIMAGEGPDIFSLSQKLPFEKLTDSKTIADVNELISEFSYDIGIDNCNSKIMDAGVIDGKRYFIPLFYSPDVFITTEETLNKYNLTSSEFSFKALSEKLSKNKKEYSLFGSADDNIAFFYSFLDQYIDFNSGNTEFNSDKFSEDLDSIYSLIKNDTTDENVYYFLYENINNGASILYKEMPAFSIIVKTYSCLKYLGSTPVFVNNYNMDDDSISASIDVGIAVNDNCKNKEKLLPFIKYCLSCDVQKNMSEECMYLPVNSDAMEKCIDSIDEAIDFGDLIVSDKEKAIVETAQSAAIRDYKYIINNITKCNLYGFNYLSDTYFNSSVISDIVDKYLNGDISNEKFIRQLTAATEIYLKE
ncbi:ABC transporter substrate-binding protein [Pseudoruminococcus massiliensis]|jgi:ABC-type glycerol-3-phosphate transport system substrate-binding protein|uniref:ABC transporter substrate-binding protein n=1 Tax=Pseudoruminococcus massiliensis TaxID=2086583 RepID=UPI00131A528A|nr:ABC transporter substrate-binding protein [Pseudoruminococcus massiliensis]